MNNYVNPYFPNRKIRHAKLLVEAGFYIDERWFKNKPTNKRPTLGTKLIYWTNEKNEMLVFFDYEQISLKRFLENYSSVVKRNYKNKIHLVFPDA